MDPIATPVAATLAVATPVVAAETVAVAPAVAGGAKAALAGLAARGAALVATPAAALAASPFAMGMLAGAAAIGTGILAYHLTRKHLIPAAKTTKDFVSAYRAERRASQATADIIEMPAANAA